MTNVEASRFVFFLISSQLFDRDWRAPLFEALQNEGGTYFHFRLGRQSILTDPRTKNPVSYSLQNFQSLARKIRTCIPDGKIPVYFVSTSTALPSLVLALRFLLPHGLWIFDVYDDFSLYYVPRLTRLKGHLVNLAFYQTMTATIIAPPNLRRKFPKAYDLAMASDVNWVERKKCDFKRALVTSNLDDRLDYDFLRDIAHACPDREIDIYGRIINPARDRPRLDELLRGAGNIKYLGEYSDTELQDIIADYSIALAPFQAGVYFTRSTDPARFYDYLNGGLEVISTAIPRAVERSEFIHVVSNAVEAVRVWREVEESPAVRKSGRWNSREHSWQHRSKQFLEILATIHGR